MSIRHYLEIWKAGELNFSMVLCFFETVSTLS